MSMFTGKTFSGVGYHNLDGLGFEDPCILEAPDVKKVVDAIGAYVNLASYEAVDQRRVDEGLESAYQALCELLGIPCVIQGEQR